MVKKGYEHIDVTFSITNELEMELYKHMIKKGELIGNGKYIKQLIQEDMKKAQKEWAFFYLNISEILGTFQKWLNIHIVNY